VRALLMARVDRRPRIFLAGATRLSRSGSSGAMWGASPGRNPYLFAMMQGVETDRRVIASSSKYLY
jgi:hypothetical protein